MGQSAVGKHVESGKAHGAVDQQAPEAASKMEGGTAFKQQQDPQEHQRAHTVTNRRGRKRVHAGQYDLGNRKHAAPDERGQHQ